MERIMKNILLLVGVFFVVTGCSNIEFKRSANSKLFDTRGFDGGKRRPLYNKKYIDRAKQNIIMNDYDDEEFESDGSYEQDETMDPYAMNLKMYNRMVKRDKARKRNIQDDYDDGVRKNLRRGYSDVGHAKDLAKAQGSDAEGDLHQELAEIKSMLSSAKKDLAKYRCPMQDNATDDQARVKSTQQSSSDVRSINKKHTSAHTINSDARLIPQDKSINATQISSLYEDDIKMQK
jgi:hypothetical protein